MTRELARAAKPELSTRITIRLIVCALLVAPLLVAARAASPASAAQSGTSTTPTDDFNRADGGLGSNWSAVTYGALSISGQAVVGTSATAGAIRTGEAYAGDQTSQVEVTSAQLSGGQYIGPAVRMQSGGQDMYLGIYYWNNGTQQLRLYKSKSGNWTQLGSSFNSGPLAAGTQLKLTAVGSTISFLQNGVARISRDRLQRDGWRARHPDLRHRQGRQLGRQRGGPARADLFGGRDRVGVVRDGGVAEQRR